MSVCLTDNDRRLLDGTRGEGTALAMRIVVRMAEVYEAAELLDIEQAHIDACGLLSEAGLEFAETLAAKGARVAVPTTLNMGPLDLAGWEQFGIDRDFAERGLRQATAYESMGCVPTWTCAPYQGYLTPRFGRQVAWGESNAVCYANSVLGARTNRYGDFLDICCAITGRAPAAGLHLDTARRGRVLIRLIDFPPDALADDALYPVLGHWLGGEVGDDVAVLEGLSPRATTDQLKHLCAAAASAGSVALFHAVGVTPEAPTREAAFAGQTPEREITLRPADLAEAWRDLSTATDDAPLQAVVVGCPHYSFDEFRRLGELLRSGGPKSPNVRFIVITSRQSRVLIEQTDIPALMNAFGAEVTLDTCVFHTPMLTKAGGAIMTDSGKCAYYTPGELSTDVAYGSLADCVRSARAGRVCREVPPWLT